MRLKEGRVLKQQQLVEVYRNLHSGLDFSVRDRYSKLVHAVGSSFILKNVYSFISLCGRERVLREKRKHVHAYLKGEYIGVIEPLSTQNLDELYYNPYLLDHFINKRTGEQINYTNAVYFAEGKAWLLPLDYLEKVI